MSSFKPNMFINVVGDMLEITWSPETYTAKWVNRYLTLLYGVETNEVIGVEITNFSSFLKTGIRLDPEYDEFPPLSEKEQAEIDEILVDLLGAPSNSPIQKRFVLGEKR